MSEQQNVEVIQGIYAAFGRGDVPHIISQLTDDVRWYSHVEPLLPTSGDWSGKAKVPGFFQAIGEHIEVSAFNPRQVAASGDTVVSMGDFGGRVKKNGRNVSTQFIFVWRLRDGRVYSYEQFHDYKLAEAFR